MAPAVIHADRQVGYGALDSAVCRAAGWLAREGVRPGTVVALTLVDPLAYLLLSLTLLRMGAIQASLTPGTPPGMRADLLRLIRPAMTVTDAAAGTDDPAVLHLPDIESWIEATGDVPAPPFPDAEALAVLAVGSGSTGRPKVIPVRQRHLIARSLNDLAGWPVAPGERVLILQAAGTLTHLARSLFALHAGATLVIAGDAPRADRFAAIGELIDRHRIRHLHCTPPGAGLLVRAFQDATEPRFPDLRVRIGAAIVGPRLRADVRRVLSPVLSINYGANEVGSIACGSPGLLHRHPEAVGRALPWNAVEIVDPDGRPVAPGTTGRIRVRGPAVVAEYLEDPQATAERFRDGWFYPGDIGMCTPDGAIHLAGRDDDMMILAGVNIFPAEIERLLEAHPAIDEVVVLAIPSPTFQDIPAAFVTTRAPVTESEILSHARDRLGFRAPRQVHILDAMPRNAAGKIVRAELRARARPPGDGPVTGKPDE
ncbi:acyl-CoA synthetase [Allostella sp. ATCC 35155]|nr:acyl-CoA synthetase [Stella sp. ATCC 35155]